MLGEILNILDLKKKLFPFNRSREYFIFGLNESLFLKGGLEVFLTQMMKCSGRNRILEDIPEIKFYPPPSYMMQISCNNLRLHKI